MTGRPIEQVSRRREKELWRSIAPLACIVAIGAILFSPVQGRAADLRISSESMVRGFKREMRDGRILRAAPAYEYLQLDYGHLNTSGLSLHANGWGRINLGDNYNNGDSAGELLYAYLQYVQSNRDFQVRAGRQYVFEGVARDSIDGIFAKAELIPSITVAAYAGSPSSFDSTGGRRGDLMFGGKISHSRPGRYDLGFSYKFTADDNRRDEDVVGADVALLFSRDTSLFGHSTYNLVSDGWGEHSYELRFPLGPVAMRPFFQYFRYADFLNSRSNSAAPFRFLQGTDDTITVAGTEAFWYPSDKWELAARVKNYMHNRRFGTSQLYTLLATRKWRVVSEVGGEFGRMQGSSAENRYYLGRGYFYRSGTAGFVTGDMMYVHYDRMIYGKRGSFFASVGVGRKFLDDALGLKVSFDYSNDPYFDSDFRSIFKLTYALDKSSKPLDPRD